MKPFDIIRFGGYLIGHFALAAALLVSVCAADELTIQVSSFPPGLDLKPGTAVLLSVTGTDAELIWHRVEVEGDVVLPLGRQYLFAGTASGTRTFVVQVPGDGQDQFAIASFDYGTKEEPVPPDPPIPPVPPGEKLVVLVNETLNSSADSVLRVARVGRYLYESKLTYRRADPNQTEAGKTPGWLQVVLDRQVKQPVLAVVVRSSIGDYSVVGAESLPATLDEAKAFLAKYGVK